MAFPVIHTLKNIDFPTDQRTDEPTDRSYYRDPRAHRKGVLVGLKPKIEPADPIIGIRYSIYSSRWSEPVLAKNSFCFL